MLHAEKYTEKMHCINLFLYYILLEKHGNGENIVSVAKRNGSWYICGKNVTEHVAAILERPKVLKLKKMHKCLNLIF